MSDHRRTIEEHSRRHPPLSTAQAAAGIEWLTGVRREPIQVCKFPKGLGPKFRKLGMIPARADAAEQARFLDDRLWPRPRQARRLRRVGCFVAAAHFVRGTFPGYLWCFERLLIRGPSGRKWFQIRGRSTPSLVS